MTLRSRIEQSQTLAKVVAAVAGAYLALCNRTTHWDVDGLDELQTALRDGPVLLVMWHSRSIMGALHWPVADGPLSSLHDRSPIGRVSGALQRRAGLQPIEMSRKYSNLAASRTVLRRVRDGVSIGMTGDGPLGPALAVKDAPLDWARAAGVPVFCYAYSTHRGRRLGSWDKMLFPYPFGRGAYVFARFDGTITRQMDTAALESLREDLKAFMIETTASADALVGLPPGP